MNDLAFWQQLRSRQFDDAELPRKLDEMAKWPARERMPFLGFLPPLFRHLNAEVRAAALRCLGECRGMIALEYLVKALQDPEPSVRAAVVETMRLTLNAADWARWAHVLFHPRADVRQAAIRPDREFPPPVWWMLYLLPDPECTAVARERLKNVVCATESLPVIVDYAGRGILTRAEARHFTCRMTWPSVVDFLSKWGVRDAAECQTFAEALESPEDRERITASRSMDPLDGVFELFTDGAGEEDQEWLDAQVRSILAAEPTYRQRVLASVLVNIAREGSGVRGQGSEDAQGSGVSGQGSEKQFFLAKLAGVIDPKFLSCPWLPVACRRAALQGFYDLREQTPKLDSEEVFRLLKTDICYRDDGMLDLWAVGAVLHLFPSNPYERFLSRHPVEMVASAFSAAPEASVPFLGLADRSPRGRRYLIRELCLQPRPERARLLAKLCEVVPVDSLDFIEHIQAFVACEIALQLLEWRTEFHWKKATRLAVLLSRQIEAGQVGPFLQGWLNREQPQDDAFGLSLLTALSRHVEPRFLEQAVRTFSATILRKLLAVVAQCSGFPYDQELAISRQLIEHGEEDIRSWAAARLQPPASRFKELDPSAKEGLLRSGHCHRLRALPDPVTPEVTTCASLLASHDLPAEVDAQFVRFSFPDTTFAKKLDEEMILNWRDEARLPMLGHVWLYRWDAHAETLSRLLAERSLTIAAFLEGGDDYRSPLLRQRTWEAAARLIEVWRWKEKSRYDTAWTNEFAEVLVKHLGGDCGEAAAQLLMTWQKAFPDHAALQAVRDRIVSQLPELDDAVRTNLKPWIDPSGLAIFHRAIETIVAREAGVNLADCDIDELFHHVATSIDISQKAAARLVELGEIGRSAIVKRIVEFPPSRAWLLTETIAHWSEGEHLEEMQRIFLDGVGPAETRYRIASALCARGQQGLVPAIIVLLNEPGPTGWFTASDWREFLKIAEGEGFYIHDLRKLLAISPHPHVYDPILMGLLAIEPEIDLDVQNALTSFLQCGTERMRDIRVRAAHWLHEGVGQSVLTLLLQAEAADPPTYPNLLAHQPYDVVLAVVHGFLLLGTGEGDENLILNLLMAPGVDSYACQEGLSLLLQHIDSRDVRKRARQNLKPRYTREMKLRRVADTFAWGVRIGRELTGKLYGVEMISGRELGYTRFTENKIYITPLPILRGEMNGRQVVRALILHEYGHHMYHRGDVAQEVWKKSEREGMQRILNLVSDEHLERNLRALDHHFGDQLKMLAAYAFQHTSREIKVEDLLTALRGRAFEVLSTAPLDVAKMYGAVAVLNGRILMLMEKVGLSFARFMRALRMGLGNRHDDPKVEAGLELFRGKFRKSSMPKLYEISLKLREIFGWETDILNSFDQDALSSEESSDWDDVSEGLTNEEIQTEVQNSLQGKKGSKSREGGGSKGLNLGPEEHFDLITETVPMTYDPAAHGSYAMQVARPARLFRTFLNKLGVGLRQQKFRLSGKSFDRSRARAVVLRGDPRMLIARELHIITDLFIGVVIDCSGSMANNANIEKAKLFGTLIAEAGRSYPGVDVRLFGFTDRVVYDAGNANRCAVHALEAGGGNNDAAGLWHAALAAKASRRRAKLLVMISDGAPTECSVTALRSLVTRLTKRMKMCCAQVAVCPLDHQCFPNHILLDSENVDASVIQFGNVMAKLVQKALRGG
ncbi:MAG: HEAT repeat domain-containing protein [Planctomycetes bacterium]|nr:HEAT repeat domain-containing protein [Planctomycetota bacterium]